MLCSLPKVILYKVPLTLYDLPTLSHDICYVALQTVQLGMDGLSVSVKFCVHILQKKYCQDTFSASRDKTMCLRVHWGASLSKLCQIKMAYLPGSIGKIEPGSKCDIEPTSNVPLPVFDQPASKLAQKATLNLKCHSFKK